MRPTYEPAAIFLMILVAFFSSVELTAKTAYAQSAGDDLWNIRANSDDRFHDNDSWLRPWRYDHDDGWGIWVGGHSYPVEWYHGPCTQLSGALGGLSWNIDPNGNLSIGAARDWQWHAWSYVYVDVAKSLYIPASGDCVPRMFLNYAFNTPIQFPGTLNLVAGWNRIDLTGYNQNSGYAFDLNYPLANHVDIMNSALNQPPVANAGGPYAQDEGTPVLLDASGSSDPDGDPLEYRWDFDNDGIWDTPWSGNPTASYTWGDDWSGQAKVEVSDGLFIDEDEAVVTVNNVDPDVTAADTGPVYEGSSVSIDLVMSDPGSDDLTYTVDWADGTPPETRTETRTSLNNPAIGPDPYPSPEINPRSVNDTFTYIYGDNHDDNNGDGYPASLTVTDDDGGLGDCDLTIEVNNVVPSATIDSVDQPNPRFILPGQVLTFTGSFTDPGWLDTHTSLWDFGDGTTAPGELIEENEAPDATGTSTVEHAYSAPDSYQVTLTITDDELEAGTSSPRPVEVLDAEQAIVVLDEYIQGLPNSAFKGQAAQRKNALQNKLAAVIQLIGAEEYQQAIDKLQNDVRAKADGLIDGNPNDDWIVDSMAQQEICRMIDDIMAYLETLLAPSLAPAIAEVSATNGKHRTVPGGLSYHTFAVPPPYPQPCNPEVWIPYQLGLDSQVVIRVYDIAGHLVRTLDPGQKPAGSYIAKNKAAHWDGNNQAGERVSSGVYYYTIQAGDYTATGRIVVSR